MKHRHASLVVVGGRIESVKTIAATRSILEAVRALRDRGPSATALDEAKAVLRGGSGRSLRTRTWSPWKTRWWTGCPWTLQRRQGLEAIGAEDVRAVMRRYFAEDRFGVVLGARLDQLDAWPADLDMGPVQRRDGFGRDQQ